MNRDGHKDCQKRRAGQDGGKLAHVGHGGFRSVNTSKELDHSHGDVESGADGESLESNHGNELAPFLGSWDALIEALGRWFGDHNVYPGYLQIGQEDVHSQMHEKP